MGNFYMEATQINYRRDDTIKTVDQKLQELSQESAIDTDIAPVFKSTDTYQPGDMVYYRNKLYVFNVEHTGAWAAADVTATNVSSAMNAALATKADNTALAVKVDYDDIAGAFSAETAYDVGDLVIYNGTIYRCTNAHEGDWDADDFSATTISGELNAINSNISTLVNGEITASENVTISSYILKKSIKTVDLQILATFTPTIDTPQLITVLPSGFRPLSKHIFAGENDSTGKLVKCECDSYGAVRIYPTSDDSTAVASNYYLCLTFLVA